jgi:hypothetical protein
MLKALLFQSTFTGAHHLSWIASPGFCHPLFDHPGGLEFRFYKQVGGVFHEHPGMNAPAGAPVLHRKSFEK